MPGFLTYAAGRKIYGSGRSNPTSGPVDKLGYRERDLKHKVRRQAVLNRLRKQQRGKYMSPESLRGAR